MGVIQTNAVFKKPLGEQLVQISDQVGTLNTWKDRVDNYPQHVKESLNALDKRAHDVDEYIKAHISHVVKEEPNPMKTYGTNL